MGAARPRCRGRHIASLTDHGTAYVEEQRVALGEPRSSPEHDHASALTPRRQLRALVEAVGQVAGVGTCAQNAAAAPVPDGARRGLYRVLVGNGASTES